jgi:Family of unknown function (DUF6463)
MRLFARPDPSEHLMVRRTEAAGWLLLATAALHAAFGLWIGRRALLAMAHDGFVNAVDAHLDRMLVFWFLLMSPFLWIVGRFALWLASEGRRPPVWLGRSLLLLPATWLWLAARAPRRA